MFHQNIFVFKFTFFTIGIIIILLSRYGRGGVSLKIITIFWLITGLIYWTS